jgi:hypothetical protein
MSTSANAQEFMKRASELMRAANEEMNKLTKESIRKLSPIHDSFFELFGLMAVHIGTQEGEIKAFSSMAVQNARGETSGSDICDTLNELEERKLRARNVILLNVPEADLKIPLGEQLTEDSNQVNVVVSNIDKELVRRIVKVSRLGRRKETGARPIKIMLEDQESASSVIFGRTKLPKEVRVKHDLTYSQRMRVRKLWEEVDHLKKNGETNVTVRFVNGSHRIVPMTPKNLGRN